MATRISRRVLAEHVAQQLASGKQEVVAQLAAFLVENRRTKELPLIVRDIEDALVQHGTVVVDVVSAHELTRETEKAIAAFVAKSYKGDVRLRTSVNSDVLGGVRVRTPDAELDATLRRKIINLQATKI